MAAIKPADPIKSIEGMFNGCINRIGQAIRDPVNYGPSTKGVLTECSKRFQDALDDCAYQILDAKFYLEHQLALNKSLREAKAREESAASAKRKHDEIKDAEEKEQSAKRAKLEEQKVPETAKQVRTPEPPAKATATATAPDKKQPQPPKLNTVLKPPPATPSAPAKAEPPKPSEPIKSPEKPPEEPPSQPLDDFPRPTPNATPGTTTEEFNFESMFADPTGDDPGGSLGNGEGNMVFELTLDDDFTNSLDPITNENQDLNTLLPGLASYANQTPDETGLGIGLGIGDQSNSGAVAMNFDLPALPNSGPNDFDAFLDANEFDIAGGDVNFNDDDPINNLENMDNMDFDSMF